MFKRLLIANRGEIAVRIIRACQELGIQTVAVYSDADYDALHVRLADQAYPLGPAPAEHSYLNGEAIIAVAQEAQADAIHPGYGFLSENAEFAAGVTQAGLSFVGPRAETIRKAGNKDIARSVLLQAGLPMAPGTGAIIDSSGACRAAEEIGYPVILKPSNGGGGCGIHIADNQRELLQAMAKTNAPFESARSVLLEKYVASARHIEVQIVADSYGHVIHLGERECSLQRRNQKVLEEAPSSGLSPDMRQQVGELAVRAAKALHYSSIGTVEFLMDKNSGNFYFMEINPRIQVEHGITEAITGVDLVKTQILLAAGEPLTLCQEEIAFTGHAIECRINAEDPRLNFLPSPGQITFYHQPGGPGIRVDSGVCAGTTVHSYYDSLIAKVIAHGRTRGEAIRIMQRALGEFRVEGVRTTIGLHLELLADPLFRSGDIDTQFISKRMIS
ncbi:MAG TPA: acetyl-CoA carboxylase biotin carboxylase subunit [Selenomonadales bacterium]|nr:acetyl-CoA carboxylase biotin carboxylase subunit [Selenomonadales bacterium]